MEYKVITVRDTRLRGRFDPRALEQAINGHAAEGWRVISAFTAASLWKSSKAEIMILLERAPA